MYAEKLFHQCGHNTKWNIDALEEDNAGGGLILSPVHYTADNIRQISQPLRQRSFFDPQFYLPNSQKKKLTSYPFFPETIAGGFSTQQFLALAREAAKGCIDFQVESDFDRVVIPSRFISQMRRDYIQSQEQYTLLPFLDELSRQAVAKPVYFSLALTAHMLDDPAFLTEILNWVTSYPEINGLYVSVADDRRSKQIGVKSSLDNLYAFATEVCDTGLSLVLGHLNAEAVLMGLVSDVQLTFGAYENTRIFSIDKFVATSDDRRGPKARIYLPGLFNWVQLPDAKEIKRRLPNAWAQVHVPTHFSEEALNSPVEPGFQSPLLYRHFFIVFASQIDEIRASGDLRESKELLGRVRNARRIYREIANAGYEIEKHGSGEHLDAWEQFLALRTKGV
jgi:hypothetical protein